MVKTELNAFFMIGRSIGFTVHYQDQKELNEPLYRTDANDIFYNIKLEKSDLKISNVSR